MLKAKFNIIKEILVEATISLLKTPLIDWLVKQNKEQNVCSFYFRSALKGSLLE